MKTHPCFFCLVRTASKQLVLPPDDWPPPLPGNTKIALCDHCARHLSAEAKADAIMEYVRHLRLGAN